MEMKRLLEDSAVVGLSISFPRRQDKGRHGKMQHYNQCVHIWIAASLLNSHLSPNQETFCSRREESDKSCKRVSLSCLSYLSIGLSPLLLTPLIRRRKHISSLSTTLHSVLLRWEGGFIPGRKKRKNVKQSM